MYRTAQVSQTYTARRKLFGGISVSKIVNKLALMMEIAHERRQLKQLDPRALEDMGLDQAAARRESQRAFWDLPIQRKIER